MGDRVPFHRNREAFAGEGMNVNYPLGNVSRDFSVASPPLLRAESENNGVLVVDVLLGVPALNIVVYIL